MKLFAKFFICPNCKSPLMRKSALKRGAVTANDYCGKCGAKITSAQKKALAKAKKSD